MLFMACLNQDFTTQEKPSTAAPAIHSIFQQKPRPGMQRKIILQGQPAKMTRLKGKRQSRWNLPKEMVSRVREGLGVKTALKLRNYSSWWRNSYRSFIKYPANQRVCSRNCHHWLQADITLTFIHQSYIFFRTKNSIKITRGGKKLQEQMPGWKQTWSEPHWAWFHLREYTDRTPAAPGAPVGFRITCRKYQPL